MSILKGFEDYRAPTHSSPRDEIRVLHLSTCDSIPAVTSSTYKIYTPHLLRNIEKIYEIEPITEQYGSHDRHKVDIYQARPRHDTKQPQQHESSDRGADAAGDNRSPILVFLYGGGMVRGDRILKEKDVPKGLMFRNLGVFFAERGLTTCVMDYRRVSLGGGGEGAVSFPPC